MANDWLEKLENAPFMIVDAFTKARTVINMPQYEPGKILCSISGGADSDIMLDLIYKIDETKKVQYVFFNTGIEYKATLDHIDYLEKRYGITIIRKRAVKPIPVCVKEYGQPVLSKQISEFMSRLQKRGFQWQDEPLEILEKRYPKCRAALRWWCNDFGTDGKLSRFDISYKKYLKEYILSNPPTFPISANCCTYAKKKVAEQVTKEYDAQLNIVGVRKAEGGGKSLRLQELLQSRYQSWFRPISPFVLVF